MSAARTRARPTKRLFFLGLGALALFAVGTNVQAGWVLAVAALLAGVLVTGAVLPLRGLRGVEVVRRTPRTATAGRPVPISLATTNSGRGMRALVRLTDDFCGKGAALVPLLRSGQTREYSSDREGARRGVYEGGRCLLETGAPFGVVLVRRTVDVASPIVVYPAVYDVPPGVLYRLTGRRVLASDGEVSSVRDYRRGDPLRRIHWRSSARRGQLVVHELEIEQQADLTVAVDVPADPDVAEAVASIACSLALAAIRDGGDVALLAAGEGRARSRRVRTAEGVLDWGARLAPGSSGFGTVLGRAADAGAIVCVCPAATATDRLCALAQESSVFVALVRGEQEPAQDRTEERLRAAGATVASVSSIEVDAWFATGCAAS